MLGEVLGLAGLGVAFMTVLAIIAIWELIWKGIALWYSAKDHQKVWFVCILIFNTLGILPIIYLLIHKNNKVNQVYQNITKTKKKR